MFGEVNGAVSRERLLGGELARAAEALLAENAVGLLVGEQATGHVYDAAGFNEALAASLGQAGRPLDRPVTSEELDAIRAL